MFGSNKKKEEKIPDDEWNFAEILEGDAETCFPYEMAREVERPEIYFSVFAFREQVPFALERMSITPEENLEASIEFKQVRATMYIRPFDMASSGQASSSKEMLPGLYFLHPDKSFRGYPAVLEEIPWLALDDNWQGNLQLYAEQYLIGVAFYATGESQKWEQQNLGIVEKSMASGRWQLQTIKVDWSRNDGAITEGFAAWLRRKRPKEFPSTSWTGRQSTVDGLNALSALRLRHNYSIEDAAKHTKTVLGKSLYTDRSSWDRAQRRAIQLFMKKFSRRG